MQTINKFPALCRLAGVLFVAAILWAIGLVSTAITLVFVFQLFELARAPRVSACFNAGLTPAQTREFTEIMEQLKEFGEHIPALLELAGAKGGLAGLKHIMENFDDVQGSVKKLRKNMAAGGMGNTGVRWIGNQPFVTDECAAALSSIFVLETARIGEKGMNALNPNARSHEGLIRQACSFLGMEIKAALTPTEIPLPTIFAPQIVELVFAYGAARQYATVFPLGSGLVKLPRLKAGEDDFGFLGVGTAGNSQNVPEKKVTAELMTFTANKFGGMIRIPFELEEDTFIQLGQFLARYIGRQLAKGEDKCVFLADGSGTYANIVGVGPYCVANPTYLQVLGAGKTKPTDATLNDFRLMRTKVNAAVLSNMAANGQTAAAYYLNPTLEALLVTFNTIGSPQIYKPQSGNQPATLDGFPIHWVGVTQPYGTNAAPSAFLAFFGDLSYVYLGERGSVRVEVSKEVFFQTDELAMRALERIDVEIMAIDAISTLQLAAA